MRKRRQRGVAVVTALLLTTLAVAIVASLFWQQQVQVRSMENQRLHLQTKWIVRGALDWARLILRQDGFDNPLQTTLDGVWATPLAETRLDQYIERERVAGEIFNATLSGQIYDAQARYNLTNLVNNGKVDPEQLAIFRRLLQNVGVDPALALPAAEAVTRSQPPLPLTPPPSGAKTAAPPAPASTPMPLVQVDDLLSVPGYTPALLAKLRDYVIILEVPGAVNVNTAPAEVLAAVVDFSVSEARSLVAERKRAYFKDTGDFTNLRLAAYGKALMQGAKVEVVSSYFLVTSRVRLDRAALDAQALVRREPGGTARTTLAWVREN